MATATFTPPTLEETTEAFYRAASKSTSDDIKPSVRERMRGFYITAKNTVADKFMSVRDRTRAFLNRHPNVADALMFTVAYVYSFALAFVMTLGFVLLFIFTFEWLGLFE